MLVRAMYISAAVTVVIAIVLGATVAPALYAIALVALVDLGLAWAYASGRLKLTGDPRLGRPEEGGVVDGPGDPSSDGEGDATRAAEAASADPSYNPYARED